MRDDSDVVEVVEIARDPEYVAEAQQHIEHATNLIQLAVLSEDALLEKIAVLEDENKQMRDTLAYLANPIASIQADAKANGMQVNGAMAVALSNDAHHLKHTAATLLQKLQPVA